MSSGLRHGQKAAAFEQDGPDRVDADQNGIEVNDLRSCCRQDINGARIRVRVRTLHMNDAFIFRGFQFRQMRVNRRRFPRVRVHMEKRRNEHREKKSRYSAERRQFPHRATMIDPIDESSGFLTNNSEKFSDPTGNRPE